jgi:CelD/BcsL family acetyltransferase involved in cellulose biosynthesis
MLRIERIEPADRAEWQAACERSPHATYFHSPRWADLFTRGGGGRSEPAALSVAFDDGARAVIPLVRMRRLGGLVTPHLCTAGSNYGGWISGDTLRGEHAGLLAGHILSMRDVTWRENPFDPLQAALEWRGARVEQTQIIDLTRGIDTLYQETTHAHKKALKKASREGVTVREGAGEKDWRAYFDVYLAALEQWSRMGPEKRTRARYGWDLFRLLMNEPSPHEKLWIALRDGCVVAGIVCFYWGGRHMVTWHAAALAEYNQYRPNNALYWEIVCDAERRGFSWFDFNPSGGYEGVVSFKDNFGGEKRRSRVVDRRSWARALAGRLKSLR